MNAFTKHEVPTILKQDETTNVTPITTGLEAGVFQQYRPAIAYNPYSLDSLLAASLLLLHPKWKKARMVVYNQFNTPDELGNFTHVFFTGVELSELDFTRLMTATTTQVQATAYRDSYQWINSKTRKRFMEGDQARFQIHQPIDDYYDELMLLTDNTAIKIVQFILQKEEIKIPEAYSDAATGIVDIASRFVSNAYPIMPLKVKLGHGTGDFEAENANKSILLDATNKLRLALIHNDAHDIIKNLSFEVNVVNYLAHFRHVRYAMLRSLTKRSFKISGKMGMSKTITLPVVPASEMAHADILNSTLQQYSEVLTYEDIGNYRIWRICAETPARRHELATIFKPVSTWSEGAAFCALTHLEHVQ